MRKSDKLNNIRLLNERLNKKKNQLKRVNENFEWDEETEELHNDQIKQQDKELKDYLDKEDNFDVDYPGQKNMDETPMSSQGSDSGDLRSKLESTYNGMVEKYGIPQMGMLPRYFGDPKYFTQFYEDVQESKVPEEMYSAWHKEMGEKIWPIIDEMGNMSQGGGDEADPDLQRKLNQQYATRIDHDMDNGHYYEGKTKTFNLLNETTTSMFDKLCGVKLIKEGGENYKSMVINLFQDMVDISMDDSEDVVSDNKITFEPLVLSDRNLSDVGLCVEIYFEAVVDGHLGKPEWDGPEFEITELNVEKLVLSHYHHEEVLTMSGEEANQLLQNNDNFKSFLKNRFEKKFYHCIALGYGEPDEDSAWDNSVRKRVNYVDSFKPGRFGGYN